MEICPRERVAFSRGSIKKLNWEIVRAAFVESGENKAKAARILNFSRATLYCFFNETPDFIAQFMNTYQVLFVR